MSYTFRGVTMGDETKDCIDAYVEKGTPTGSFLQAVIDNDLKKAFDRADDRNAATLRAIVAYFYNFCPAGCWGFKGAYSAWIAAKRLERQS